MADKNELLEALVLDNISETSSEGGEDWRNTYKIIKHGSKRRKVIAEHEENPNSVKKDVKLDQKLKALASQLIPRAYASLAVYFSLKNADDDHGVKLIREACDKLDNIIYQGLVFMEKNSTDLNLSKCLMSFIEFCKHCVKHMFIEVIMSIEDNFNIDDRNTKQSRQFKEKFISDLQEARKCLSKLNDSYRESPTEPEVLAKMFSLLKSKVFFFNYPGQHKKEPIIRISRLIRHLLKNYMKKFPFQRNIIAEISNLV